MPGPWVSGASIRSAGVDTPSRHPYQYPMTREELCAKYGTSEADWIDQQMRTFWNLNCEEGYDCVDNSRLARQSDAADMAEYETAANSGCCGFYEGEFGPSPEGHTYAFGFNYGH